MQLKHKEMSELSRSFMELRTQRKQIKSKMTRLTLEVLQVWQRQSNLQESQQSSKTTKSWFRSWKRQRKTLSRNRWTLDSRNLSNSNNNMPRSIANKRFLLHRYLETAKTKTIAQLLLQQMLKKPKIQTKLEAQTFNNRFASRQLSQTIGWILLTYRS